MSTDELDQDEDWVDADDEFADDDLEDCPECGAEIYADSEQCSKCGYWVTDVDHRASESASGWKFVVKVVVVGLLLVFLYRLMRWGSIL